MQMSNRMAGMKSALTSRVSVPAVRWRGAEVGAGRGDPSAAIARGDEWGRGRAVARRRLLARGLDPPLRARIASTHVGRCLRHAYLNILTGAGIK